MLRRIAGPHFKHGIPDVEGFPAARPASDMAAPPEDAAAAAVAASSAAAGQGGATTNGTASGTASATAASTALPGAAASAGEAAGMGLGQQVAPPGQQGAPPGQQGVPPPQPEEAFAGGTALQAPAGLTLQDVLRQDAGPDAAALLQPYPSDTQVGVQAVSGCM